MSRPPNIILVNCDDLGFGDLSCYGSTINDTPTLDRMAAEGVRFTSFYMASPICSPSRGAMMTGCYPPRIGFDLFDGRGVLFPGQPCGMNPNEKTIANVLSDAGYATMIVGKWHCGDQPEFLPTRFGFDHYFGLPYSNDMGVQRGTREPYPPLPLLSDDKIVERQPSQATLTERYVEQGVRFIRQSGDKPFFLYFAHMYVHLPLYVSQKFRDKSRNGAYGGAVACIDWAMSALMDELRARGIENDTLIVFTSDNGARGTHGGSNGELRGSKGSTWEGGQRVPCIAHWPGRIKPGRVSDEMISSIDLLPTFATLAGGALPTDRVIDGVDASDLMLGNTDEGPRDTFFYYLRDHLEAVRDRQFKLRVGYGSKPVVELYDLKHDVSERNDIAAQHPDVVARLSALADECRRDLGDGITGVEGTRRRPQGRVTDPKPLTVDDDADIPLIVAEYDLADRG